MAVCFTKAVVDDRSQLEKLFKGLKGLAAGDKGYISTKQADKLEKNGLKLITKVRKNMKPKSLSAFEKFFLAKRAVVEAVIGQLKEICQIEHSRQRKVKNFAINAIAALIAYTRKPRKPSINLAKFKNQALIPN